jgi:2,4-dienoyl-CoA reductase-like NADH-dependent reductase (Old Yellow Enzyme family)
LRGPAWKNRIALAPLTNQQSHADGTLSDDEYRWLTMRAHGGFGLVMTCAAHVSATGQGFPGQLGIWSQAHMPGLARLADAIRETGAVSSVQLHHAGRRSPPELIGGQPVCAFDDPETGARAVATGEVEVLVEGFVSAGIRAQEAGFDGVEIHGAHGYLVGQFLDAENNHRTDGWGGDATGRTRFLKAIIDGLRASTRPDFQIGVRLSPERFGIDTMSTRTLVGDLMCEGCLDYVDLSLWDTFKQPVDPALQDRTLFGWFSDLPRHGTRLGATGRISGSATLEAALSAGADFAMIGRGAVLHHDFARRTLGSSAFASRALPVTRETLAAEGLGPAFVDYMSRWKGFVAE